MNPSPTPRPTRARGADTVRLRQGPRPSVQGRRPPERAFRQVPGRTATRGTPGRSTTHMVRRRRPWYRTRAYRLARTVVLAVVVMVGGARCAGGVGPSGQARATPSVTDASGPDREAASAMGASGPAPAAASPTGTPGPPGVAPSVPDTRTDARGGQHPPPAHPVTRPGRPASSPGPLPRSAATGLVIPYLDVDAPVVPLRLGSGRRMSAPPDDDSKQVGWYADGPAPGEQGTAVAVGHLDTMTGPAVFAGLGELRPGRLIEARRADGRTAVYTVDAVKTYEKAHFPDREVYGARGRPELRLITCGGSFDHRTGYSGNTVVFAHLTATREHGRTR
ncbi:class F sortase [Streptomyces sp. cg40]|uniref:class F sortase n=1 Tax=Streptomyces sp. cg40 TaxID=3419764 RepID=UPI003CFFF7F9